MALIVAIGTVLLFTMMPSKILLKEFTESGDLVGQWGDPSILAISLTTVGAIRLALLVRRSWRTTLGWLSIGILAIQALANSSHYGWHIAPVPDIWGEIPETGTWWMVTASYWVLYAALTLLVSRTIPPVMRVLAASEIVVIFYRAGPDWVYEYAHRLGLTDLLSWLAGLLHVPTADEGIVLTAAPGIGVLLSMLIAVAAWRCVVIVKSLVMVSRRGPGGVRICSR
jgi:hypothetical protein